MRNGWIIQWGEVTQTTASQLNLPVSYSSINYKIVMTTKHNYGSGWFTANPYTNAIFKYRSEGGNAQFITIGY